MKKSVLLAIQEEATLWGDKETGGVLMGYWSDEDTAVITTLVGPGQRAIHKPEFFIPDQVYHEKEIERIYTASNRTETYLGDWHTHPHARAYLSQQDKSTLRKIARYKPARLSKPLMFILGTANMESRIWHYQRKMLIGSEYPECHLVVYD